MNKNVSFTAAQLSCVRQDRALFTDLSFVLHSGDALFIEGPNGAGKSSLLRLLAGIATPLCGDVLWQAESIHANRVAFQEQLHFIGHTNGIKLGLSVLENLHLMGRLANCVDITLQSYENVLKLLQLTPHKNALAKHLSAGQRRRLALARLFLFPKQLWILDEPLTALDVATQDIFLLQLDRHLKQGGMVVASSHQMIEITQPAKTLRLPLC